MEQPAYVVEAIRHCENVANTVESELHEEHQREIERSQRKSKHV